jgi:hypothetical protein
MWKFDIIRIIGLCNNVLSVDCEEENYADSGTKNSIDLSPVIGEYLVITDSRIV